MKNTKRYFVHALAMLAGLVLTAGMASNASAAGTAAGTTISNSATVTYDVGSVTQTPITSAAATFVVDIKVDLTVAAVDGATVKVTPGASNQVLAFTVTNTGNSFHDFSLRQIAQNGGTGGFGGTDNFDATVVGIFVESGATAGYQPAEDTATFIDELAPDTARTVYIVTDIALSQANGDISSHHLVATARQNGTIGVEDPAIVEDSGTPDGKDTSQVVFADGDGDGAGSIDTANNGEHSSQSDFEVQSATLAVTKTSAVISDPFSATNPKRIPGAVVEYILTIDNSAGSADAENIVVTDLLDVTNLTFLDSAAYSGNDIELSIGGGPVTTYTGTDADSDGADFGRTSANTLTVNPGGGFTVPAGQSATVRFRVTIN